MREPVKSKRVAKRAHGELPISDRDDDLARRLQLRISLNMSGIIACAVILAYFFQPLLSLAPPVWLIFGGAFTAAGVMRFYSAAVDGKKGRTPVILFSVGALLLAVAVVISFRDEEYIADYCHVLQDRIISEKLGRGDDAQVFAALRCRPVAQGSFFHWLDHPVAKRS